MFQFDLKMIAGPALGARISTSRLLLPVLGMLFLAAVTPVFSVQIPPLADYINHLARMHVIATVDQNPLLARYYGIEWQIIPNLIMDLLVPPLVQWMDVYRAGQLFLVMIFVLQVGGCFAVHYALYRRWSPWPLVSFLFLYNNILLYGFMNYLFGLGVALWGLAAWVALRDRSPLLRGLVSLGFVLALFTCHLFTVGLYGMGLLACEASRFQPERRLPMARRIANAVAFLGPFLPVLPLMLVSPTLHLVGDIDWESTGKLDGLYYIFQNYSDLLDLSLAALVIAALVWSAQSRILALHPIGWSLLGLGVVVFMAMPRMFFGTWVADQRLPVGLVFLLIGFIRFDDSKRWCRYLLYLFVLGIAITRFVSVQVAWQQIDGAYADFRESVAQIKPGSTIMVAYADNPGGSEAFNMPLSHAACYAMIERASLVTTSFSVAGKQILTVKPGFRDRVDDQDMDPPTVSQLLADIVTTEVNAEQGAGADAAPAQPKPPRPLLYWHGWPERYDYLFVLYTEDNPNPNPDLLALVHAGRNFQLYKILPQTEDE
jgi:hypothetical protein